MDKKNTIFEGLKGAVKGACILGAIGAAVMGVGLIAVAGSGTLAAAATSLGLSQATTATFAIVLAVL